MKNDFTLIQGPPGTGKTTTATILTKELCRRYIPTEIDGIERVGKIMSKILVCAPSNSATDHLAISLKKEGCRILRVFSKKMELSIVNEDIQDICLHLIAKDEKAQKKVIDAAHVIVCTCSASADERLNPYKFK